MIYVSTLTVPSQTLETQPLEAIIKLSACTITRVSVEFTLGCYWLVGTRVLEKDHQLYPTTPDDWLVSDGQMIPWLDDYPLVDAPYELRIQAYNTDDYFQHTLRYYFEVLPLSTRIVVPEVVSQAIGTLGV